MSVVYRHHKVPPEFVFPGEIRVSYTSFLLELVQGHVVCGGGEGMGDREIK